MEDGAIADAALIDRIAGELAEGASDGVADLFHRAGSPAPVVLWRPGLEDLGHPVLRNMANAMRPHLDPAGCLNARTLEMIDLQPFEADLLDVDCVGTGFRYRHYGANVAAVRGKDMTGQMASALGGHIGVFFMALYRAAIARREAVLSLHEPPGDVFASLWRRLITPVLNDDGACDRILCPIVCDNELRAGLEAVPDPVMVIAQDGGVVFANQDARLLFGDPMKRSPRPSLLEYAGFETPLDFDRASDGVGVVRETRSAIVNDGVIVRYALTTSITLHRGKPICVLVAKPE